MKETFKIGDFVYGKVHGFLHWPAIVREVKRNTARLDFFCPKKSWYVWQFFWN